MHSNVRKTKTFALVLALALLCVLALVRPASAQDPGGAPSGSGVDPIFVAGNPSCDTLSSTILPGSHFEYKLEGSNGLHSLTNGPHTDPTNTLTATLANYNGTFFDWAANIGVDAVIVKGGPNADAFVYDLSQESTGDTQLHAPINPSNGQPFGVSHISFCYDVELEVEKDAETSFTRTNEWSIDKSVTPATWNLFKGDSGTSDYVVSVDKSVTDSDFAVEGDITVYNPAPIAASVTGVTDKITDDSSAVVATPSVTCEDANGNPVSFSTPYTLGSKQTLNCHYEADLGDTRPSSALLNTATATTNTAKLANGSGTADVVFGDTPTDEVGPSSITVDDTYANAGSPWTFTDDGSETYDRTFTCNEDEGVHNNTATIVETEQSDSASVTVNCYNLDVTKTAVPSFIRTYDWTIDKSAVDQNGDPLSKLTLATGEAGQVPYEVKVNASSQDAFSVSGTITITNPNPNADATLTEVKDLLSPGNIAAEVDCQSLTTVPKKVGTTDGELVCTYSADLGSTKPPSDLANTATATLQNYAFSSQGAIANGTTDFSNDPPEPVVFGDDPTEIIDESIDVSDTVEGSSPEFLGTVDATVDTLPKTFSYSRDVGPYETCGNDTLDNTASFVTTDDDNDTGATGQDSWTVAIEVQCKLTVIKQLNPTTDTGKFNLLIDGVAKAQNVGHNGTTGAQQVALGSHTVSETAGTSTSLSDYLSKINCGGADVNGTSTTVSFASGDGDKTCTITNTKKGSATVKKTTDGVVNPSKSIDFVLTGPGLPASGVTKNTFGDQDGVLDFGYTLVPGEQYKVCENPVPAGFTSFWKLDGTIVTPYNPNATDTPPQDLGVRCYNFSANAGQTRAFEVDNSHPGGDPRTIGYWKNWNTCTGGNQSATAAKNGGAAAGFFILNDLLPQRLSTGDANTADDYMITTCTQAVKVLSKQDQSGTNKAKDAAYELAAQLLAAKLNLAAGAETCTAQNTAVTNGQLLLDQINFTGSGSYLEKSSNNRTKALNLAATLDRYNNGNLC